jgi:hypothetical protein
MNHAMSSTCVATMSDHHFGHSRYGRSSIDSVDEREYKKAVQVLRNFHRRGTARPLDVIHEEERDGFNLQHEGTVPPSPATIRRQVKAENLQSLLADPSHPPALDCSCGQLQGSGDAEATSAISTATPDNDNHRTWFPRAEAKASTSCSKPPLASRRSARTKALLVWGRR